MPLELRRNGFDYTQVLREGKKAVYRQTVTPELAYYEVFIIKIRPEGMFMGKLIPEGEIFPGNEAFGKTAWAFSSIEKAMEKYNSLVQ